VAAHYYSNMKFVVGIILIVLLSGCSILHYVNASLHKKDSESRTEYNNFLYRRGLDTTYSYQIHGKKNIDSLSTEKYAINVWKLNHNGVAGPVQIRMFDNKGQFISGWENCYGELKYFNLFDTIPFRKYSFIPINTLINLQTDLSLCKINNEEALLNSIKNSDYIITVYYAKWTGYYSKNALKEILNYYIKYKDTYKILLIFINTSPKAGQTI